MRLSFNDIKNITVGAVRIDEQVDGIHFHKCTQKQVNAWLALSETLGARAEATTGIRLDFHTNSRTLAFRVSSGIKFELYINDVFRVQYKMDEHPDGIVAELNGPYGEELLEKRVTLYFPSHDDPGVLEYLELDDGATVVPHKFDTKMLFIGDSITQGWNSGIDTFSYAYRVSRVFNAQSVINGIGGAYFHDTTFDSIDFAPDTVFVAFGTNDFGHFKTIDEFKHHCRAFLESVKSEYATTAKNIYVISPIWRADAYTRERSMGTFDDCRRVVIDTAATLSLTHIDGLSLVPPIQEYFADQYLHPNALGFSIYAESLIARIR